MLLAGAAGACSSATAPAVSGCTVNSDCASKLICAFQTCHVQCNSSADCPTGDMCVESERPLNVCQGPTSCTLNTECPGDEVCGVDGHCRDQCQTARDCVEGQVCVNLTCADKNQLNADGGLAHVDGGTNAGQICSYNTDCLAPLLCRSGMCGYQCKSYRDCAPGEACQGGSCVSPDGGPLVDAGRRDAPSRGGDAGARADGASESTVSDAADEGAPATDARVDGGIDGTVRFTVGGTLSGLASGTFVTLEDNGGDDLKAAVDGPFTFDTRLAAGAHYAVTVASQPIGQTCSVMGGDGTVAANDVTNVAVSCSAASYTVSGTVTGLAAGASVVLEIAPGSPANATTVVANTGFTFPSPLLTGDAYAVTVETQPAGQLCTVTSGAGTVSSSNVTGVTVTCVDTYTVGGMVTGLGNGDSVTLVDNGGDALPITSNMGFTFATSVATGSSYDVTVSVQPQGQQCTVTQGSGSVAGANVTGVVVTCVAATLYGVGGTVSGLAAGQSVSLSNVDGDTVKVSGNSSFTFSTQEASGAPFAVSVTSSPPGTACFVGNASGVVGKSAVSVEVECDLVTATGLCDPGQIAADAKNVYWTQPGNDLVLQCPLGGCGASPITLASNEGGPAAIAVDAKNVYWIDIAGANGVFECAIGGCGGMPAALATHQDRPASVATDGTNVYWTNAGAVDGVGTIVACAATGCGGAPTTLVTGQNSPSSIAVRAGRLYWANEGQNAGFGQIYEAATSGANATLLAFGLTFPQDLAVDGTNVYWSDSQGVRACPAAGCDDAPTTLATLQAIALATDGTSVYWTTGTSVLSCAVGGCGGVPTTLSTLQQSATGIAVAGADVFWSSSTCASNMSGTILATAK